MKLISPTTPSGIYMTSLVNAVEVAESNEENNKEFYFSPTTGIRIMDGDSILENEFIAEAIASADEGKISYEDDHILLIVLSEELAHFMHLAYQYSDKHIIAIFDGTFDYEAKDNSPEGTGELITFIAQLITITESHLSK